MRWTLALGLALGLGGAASAETVLIPTEGPSGVRIGITTPFPASGGYAPLRVVIVNPSERERDWTFHFTSYTGNGGTHLSQNVLTVGSREEAKFDFVVPLGGPPGETSPLQVEVSGFGVEMPSWSHSVVQYGYPAEHKYWVAVSQSLQVDSGLPATNGFDPDLLPSDWRGLTSLWMVALTDEELASVTPEQRTALLEWTARGGRLVRLGSRYPSSETYGLGTIVRSPRPTEPAEWATLLNLPPRRQRITYDNWARRSVGSIPTRAGLLLTFLVGYAVLMGPLNLFVLCPGEKRARLFWTMPAIATAASVFLAVLIVLQDGLGGSGERVVLVRLVPELTRDVVIQEQVSRTGALLKRRFEIDEPVAIFDPLSGTGTLRGERRSVSGAFAGDWFRSRAVQTHRLEAVRPARNRIEWVGERRIHSSIDAPLDQLFYRAPDGNVFRAWRLSPGGEVTLVPASESDYQEFWMDHLMSSGPLVSEHLYLIYEERGAFLASSRAGGGGTPIGTLEGLDWKDRVLYSGRIGGRR